MGLALADAFDFWRVQGIDLRPALMLLLIAHAARERQQLCERRFERAVALDLAILRAMCNHPASSSPGVTAMSRITRPKLQRDNLDGSTVATIKVIRRRPPRNSPDTHRNAYTDIPAAVEALRQYWMPTRAPADHPGLGAHTG
jgi:hypothetical protein